MEERLTGQGGPADPKHPMGHDRNATPEDSGAAFGGSGFDRMWSSADFDAPAQPWPGAHGPEQAGPAASAELQEERRGLASNALAISQRPALAGNWVRSGGTTLRSHGRPDLLRYWDIFRRRWGTGVLVWLVVVSGVAAGLLVRQPTYRATGLIEIRRETTGAVSVDTLFGDDRLAANELETQIGILKSSSLAERVVAQLTSPSASAAIGTGSGSTPAAVAVLPADVGELSVDGFRSDLIISPKTGSRLVEVSFDSPDSHFSAAAVNAVLDTYLQLRMEDAERRADWLENELKNVRQTLQQSEGSFATTCAITAWKSWRAETGRPQSCSTHGSNRFIPRSRAREWIGSGSRRATNRRRRRLRPAIWVVRSSKV